MKPLAIEYCGQEAKKWSVAPRLEKSTLEIQVSGWIAELVYCLEYYNDTDENLDDARFVFPSETSSAIYFFEAVLNDKVIVSECREKNEATSTFQAAINTRHTAAILKEDDDFDLFRCYIGRIQPHSRASITVKILVELESPEKHLARLTIPGKSIPRNDTPVVDTGIKGKKANKQFPDWLKGLDIRGTIDAAQFTLKTVHSQDLDLIWDRDQQRFSLEKPHLKPSEEDLVIDIEYVFDELKNSVVVLREVAIPTDTCNFFHQDCLSINYFPDTEKFRDSGASSEYVLIVDRSGSMSGSSIEVARETLLLFLKSLPVSSFFQIVSFGTNHALLFPGESRPYNEENLALALQLQRTMKADMCGTNILNPLKEVLDSPMAPGCNKRLVILMTDGQISNVTEVINMVSKHCEGNQANAKKCISAVGIGTAPTHDLIKGVAREGRGRYEFVRSDGGPEMREAVMRIMRTCQLPDLDDVKIEFEPTCQTKFIPEKIDNMPMLDRLTVFAMMEPMQEQLTVTFSAKAGEHVISEKAVVKTVPTDRFLHLTAAQKFIKDLTSKNQKGEKTKEIIEVSKGVNILSNYTAFVGVEKMLEVEVQPAAPVPSVEDMDVEEEISLTAGADLQLRSQSRSRSPSPPTAVIRRGSSDLDESSPSNVTPPRKGKRASFLSFLGKKEAKSAPSKPSASLKMTSAPPPPPPMAGPSNLSSPPPPPDVSKKFKNLEMNSNLRKEKRQRRFPGDSQLQMSSNMYDPTIEDCVDTPFDVFQNQSNASKCEYISKTSRAEWSEEGFYSRGNDSRSKTSKKSIPQRGQRSNEVYKLANLQNVNGSWNKPSSELLSILKLDKTKIKSSIPKGLSMEGWITAIVCAYMKFMLRDCETEWCLLSDKAKTFIYTNSGKSADSLIDEAASVFGWT